MSNKLGARASLASIVVLSAALFFTMASCSSNDGVGGPLSRILGQALAPQTNGAQTNPVPLADGDVILLTYDEAGNLVRAQVGMTDSDGNFVVDVQAQPVVAVVVQGTTNDGDVEVSGLYNPDQTTIEKDLDPATSIACGAGISAIEDGSITDEDLDETRVQNLEDASIEYIDANPDFDIYDPDDVAAAVAEVRAATNDGANPAAPDAFG